MEKFTSAYLGKRISHCNTLNYLQEYFGPAESYPIPIRHFNENLLLPHSSPHKGFFREFSTSFAEALGPALTLDAVRPDNGLLMSLFAGMVDLEATKQVWDKSNSRLVKLTYARRGDRAVRFERTDNGFEFSINGQCIGSSFIALAETFYGIPFIDAVATVAPLVGLNFSRLFSLSRKESGAVLANENLAITPSTGTMWKEIPIPHGAVQAISDGLIRNPTYSGPIKHGFSVYRLKNRLLCLPASENTDHKWSIGKLDVSPFFMNQHELNRQPGTTVVFCADIRTALALDEALKGCQRSTQHFIVSGHLGTDLSILPWSYFWGHPVIFVPAPTAESFASAKSYQKYFARYSQSPFRIAWQLLLHAKPTQALDSVVLENPEEAELLHNAVEISSIERPSAFLHRLSENAVDLQTFIKKSQRLGIFESPKVDEMGSPSRQVVKLPPVPDFMRPQVATRLEEVSLYHVFRPGSYTLLLGAKGAGKTQLALSACRAILRGNTSWPAFPGKATDSGIVFVDGETPYDEYLTNLEQHGLKDLEGKRFFSLSKFANELPQFCANFTLMDHSFREGLRKYVFEHECRFLILDNLTALMGDAVHQGKFAQDVLTWAEQLQAEGVCVVLVHHKSEFDAASQTDKARGSQIFTIRARTVMSLRGRSEILAHSLGTPDVQKIATQDGLVVGIYYGACKAAPVLERKTFWLHLPLASPHWNLLAATGADGKEIEYSLERDTEAPAVPSTVIDLSPDEHALIEILRGGNAKRDTLQQACGFGEDKTRDLLKDLIIKGMVSKEGQGKATYYRLNSAS